MQTSAARCTSGITAICLTSGACRRRSIASDTSRSIGAASQVRIGASDDSVTSTSARRRWYERQLRRPLAADRHRDLGTQTWGVLTEAAERIRHRAVVRYDNVYQQVPAIRRGRDIVHEQFIQAIIFIPICQGEVQRPLNLPAELQCLALSLAILRSAAPSSAQRPGEIRVYACRRLSATTIAVFQENAPLVRAHAHVARTQIRTERPSTVWVESNGSRPGRPGWLLGGGQARRHRAACNRGHGLLRGCVEFRNGPF